MNVPLVEPPPVPPVHMSGHCRVACAVDPDKPAGPMAALLHERCHLDGCGCPRHGEAS